MLCSHSLCLALLPWLVHLSTAPANVCITGMHTRTRTMHTCGCYNTNSLGPCPVWILGAHGIVPVAFRGGG
ncbi:hypothetical protein DFH09DRAFT_1164380 [Mycena vulgaris]|nr:hypothetical protein DFH09DRAFT_1164380 [Mycena vulgaris]